jgi:3-deoxy-manno-octulosonate cytidylyltransferase (CMP-KDO synthetase)
MIPYDQGMGVMNVVAVIPARLGASRFPGKPLAPILGMPMVGHCALRTAMCPRVFSTHIATCDREIAEFASSIGIDAVMTSDRHERASDRVAEAVRTIEERSGRRIDVVVMVQGDEPMVTPGMVSDAVEALERDPGIQVANLMAPIDDPEDFEDPNEIKVVVDRRSDALYFSRRPIPDDSRLRDATPRWKQVCIIPFRRDFLFRYLELEPTALERAESIDMNRVLEHGIKVRMVPSRDRTVSVDTPEDLAMVERLLEKDVLIRGYLPSNNLA